MGQESDMPDLNVRSYECFTEQADRAVQGFVDAVLRAEGDGADVLYAALREVVPEVHDTATRHAIVLALVQGGLAVDVAAGAVASEFRDGYLMPKVNRKEEGHRLYLVTPLDTPCIDCDAPADVVCEPGCGDAR